MSGSDFKTAMWRRALQNGLGSVPVVVPEQPSADAHIYKVSPPVSIEAARALAEARYASVLARLDAAEAAIEALRSELALRKSVDVVTTPDSPPVPNPFRSFPEDRRRVGG